MESGALILMAITFGDDQPAGNIMLRTFSACCSSDAPSSFYFIFKIASSLIFAIMLLSLVVPPAANAFFSRDDEVPDNREIIVLLHGLGRSNASMWLLASRLQDAGYYVHRVEYSSLDQKPDDILEEVSSQINPCCQKHTQRVHCNV
jgi:hypothetical protein